MINVVDGEDGLVDVVAQGGRVHGVGAAVGLVLQHAVGEGPVEPKNRYYMVIFSKLPYTAHYDL